MLCICLPFSSITSAGVITDDISVIKKTKFSLSQVCSDTFKKEYPLINKLNSTHISCMGKKIKAVDYCDKVIDKSKFLARAKIFEKYIECIEASKIVFKYECKSNSDTLCDDKSIGCFMIQSDLAIRLKITHSSIITSENKKYLNCYFSSKEIRNI